MLFRKRYKCLIRGENFLLEDEDGVKKYRNFYTTRFVRSDNEDNAELKCLEKLKKARYLKQFRRLDLDRVPMIHFEDISLSKKQWKIGFGKGCCWYQTDDADEDGHHDDALEVEIEAHKQE